MPPIKSEIEETVRLIKQLGSNTDSNRARALQRLAFSGLTADDFLMTFEAEYARISKWSGGDGLKRWAVAIAIVVFPLVCIRSNGFQPLLVLIVLVAVWFTLSARISRVRDAFESGMAVVCAYFLDVRFIGPALDLYRNEARIEARLAPILTDLFSRLKESDADPLNARQRLKMYHELDRYCSYVHFAPDMILCMLRALELFGDRSALPVLKRLTRSARDRSIQVAARRCLTVVVERLQAGDMKKTLLRAAQGHTSSADLLRPASSGMNDESGDLLRSVE